MQSAVVLQRAEVGNQVPCCTVLSAGGLCVDPAVCVPTVMAEPAGGPGGGPGGYSDGALCRQES